MALERLGVAPRFGVGSLSAQLTRQSLSWSSTSARDAAAGWWRRFCNALAASQPRAVIRISGAEPSNSPEEPLQRALDARSASSGKGNSLSALLAATARASCLFDFFEAARAETAWADLARTCIQTRGNVTASRLTGLGAGAPNISCALHLVSCPRSCSLHPGHFSASFSSFLDSFGVASPLIAASSTASADDGGHARASSSPARAVLSFWLHPSSPALMALR